MLNGFLVKPDLDTLTKGRRLIEAVNTAMKIIRQRVGLVLMSKCEVEKHGAGLGYSKVHPERKQHSAVYRPLLRRQLLNKFG